MAEPRATLSSKPRYLPTPHPAPPSGPEHVSLAVRSERPGPALTSVLVCLCTGFGDPSPAARWAAALQADGRPFSTGTWGSPLDPHALNKGGHLGGLLVYSHPRRNGAGAWPGSSWGSRGQRAPACCLLPWRGRAALRGAMLSSPLSRCAALLSRSGTGQQEQRAQGNR